MDASGAPDITRLYIEYEKIKIQINFQYELIRERERKNHDCDCMIHNQILLSKLRIKREKNYFQTLKCKIFIMNISGSSAIQILLSISTQFDH